MSKIRTPRGGMVLSIGYEGRDLDEFVATLRFNRVDVLVDVRENAVSRKAGFSKRRLEGALVDAGIEYRHEPLLGNPKENRERFHNGKLATGKRRYLGYLNNGSRDAYDAVISLASSKRVALLCFERDEANCHRGCIIEQAVSENPTLLTARL